MLRFTMNALLSVSAMMYTALSLYACQPMPQVSVAAPVLHVPLESETAIVNILQSRPAASQPLQQAIDLYTAANPDAHVNVQTVAGDADYRVALRIRLLSGERCDIFQVFSGQEARELKPHLADLSALNWIKTAAAQSAEPLIFDSGVYGVPYSLEYQGLLLNRDIFEAAEISIPTINSFEALEASMKLLSEKTAEKATVTDSFPMLRNITDFPIQDKGYLAKIVTEIILSGEFEDIRSVISGGELKLPQGEACEDFFRLMMRYSPRGDWNERDGLSYAYQLEAFANQEIALLLCDAAGADKILELNPALVGRISLLPVMLPGEGADKIHVAPPMWWAIGAHSSPPVQESAKRFLTWLYRSESGSVVTAARLGLAAPWPDTAKESGNPLHSQMLALIDKNRFVPQIWSECPNGWGADILVPAFRSYFAGEREWEDMLAHVREEWALAAYSNADGIYSRTS